MKVGVRFVRPTRIRWRRQRECRVRFFLSPRVQRDLCKIARRVDCIFKFLFPAETRHERRPRRRLPAIDARVRSAARQSSRQRAPTIDFRGSCGGAVVSRTVYAPRRAKLIHEPPLRAPSSSVFHINEFAARFYSHNNPPIRTASGALWGVGLRFEFSCPFHFGSSRPRLWPGRFD